MSGPPSKGSDRAGTLKLLPELRRPLVLAVRNNFGGLERITGLDRRILHLLKTFQPDSFPKPIRERFAKLAELMNDYPAATVDEKRKRLLSALALLDALEAKLAPKAESESVSSTEGLREVAYPDRRPLYMSVQFVKGVGPRVAAELAARDIVTVEDLLYFLPRRFEDRRRVGRIADLQVGVVGQARGVIAAMSSGPRFGRRPFEVVVQDDSGVVTLSWFHYGAQAVSARYKVGDPVRFSGKVSHFRNRLQIVHPDLSPDNGDEADEPDRSIRPLYPDIKGVTTRRLAAIVLAAVDAYLPLVRDPMPEAILRGAGLPDLVTALEALHRPAESAEVDHLNEGRSAAHQRLAFDEFFFVQTALAQRREGTVRQAGFAHERKTDLATRFYKRFPHTLTDAQRRVLKEIVADLMDSKPMNRLLQGDVGSGKTIVAVLSALMVVENGRQAALMAPTEILAEQHFRTISALCDFGGVTVELLTADLGRADKRAVYERIESGEIDLVIGTHALIQKGVRFKNLGYVIVDEQHRFGVRQRVMLAGKGPASDCLVMTATPIPRSLAMTVYGDLDVSILDELPQGRRPIVTQVHWINEWPQVKTVVQTEIRAGRQVYVITPLIRESEKLDVSGAEEEVERLRVELPDTPIGLLHGRMPRDEKERVMRAFLEGVYDVLVATSVVEVGIDVPNATVMVVQHAERFGLSQLHQLRGRVGRGEHSSYCFLMCEKVGEEARERLSVMEETTDGFRIAERDLEIRGPGDILGTRQTGSPIFQHANLVRDQSLLVLARKLAFDLVARDPDLGLAEHADLRRELEGRWRERLKLIGIG